MKLSVVISTQPTQFQAATFSGDLDENLKKIAQMGYVGAELAVREPKLLNIDILQESLKQNHLQVPAIGTGQAWGEEGLSFTDPDVFIRKQTIERIKSHIPLASRFKAVIIIGLVRGIVKNTVSQAQAMDWLVHALKECCESASAEGVQLALEPINRYETSLINNVQEGMQLISQVQAANFGLLLDTFHMNIEEADLESSIKNCNTRIYHFHVADSNRLYPGGGHLKFPSILTALHETGYSRFVSGEFLPKPDVDTAARENIRFLSSLDIP